MLRHSRLLRRRVKILLSSNSSSRSEIHSVKKKQIKTVKKHSPEKYWIRVQSETRKWALFQAQDVLTLRSFSEVNQGIWLNWIRKCWLNSSKVCWVKWTKQVDLSSCLVLWHRSKQTRQILSFWWVVQCRSSFYTIKNQVKLQKIEKRTVSKTMRILRAQYRSMMTFHLDLGFGTKSSKVSLLN